MIECFILNGGFRVNPNLPSHIRLGTRLIMTLAIDSSYM